MSARSALDLTIAMPGLAPLRVGLSRLRTDIADWRPFWIEKFAPLFYRTMLETFILEGANTGTRWAPLSPAYAIWKRRHFRTDAILVRSGALKASLLGPNAPGAIFRPAATSLDVGTSVRYGIFHQLGTSRLPPRPPLRVDEPFMTVMGKGLQQFVQDAWKRRRAELIGIVEGGGFGLGTA